MVEKWRKKGLDVIPVKQVDKIQFLYLKWEDAKLRGLKRSHGEIGEMGIGVTES